jgi:hypothetical protein
MMLQCRVAASPYPAYKMHYPVGPVSAAPPGNKKTGIEPVFLFPYD